MNNNRNNRRRGRGNRNQGGANAANRIDSRARGNAPQLLDKYKKLAQDAQHNGDRVQAEYYLQFADHYGRVIADNKARQDEARAKRQEERGQSDEDDEDDDDRQQRGQRKPRGRSNEASEGTAQDSARDDRNDAENRKPRNTRRKAETDGDDAPPKRTRAPRKPKAQDANGEIDASVLPPSIGADDGDVVAEKKPAPRRRRKVSDDGAGDNGDAAQAVG